MVVLHLVGSYTLVRRFYYIHLMCSSFLYILILLIFYFSFFFPNIPFVHINNGLFGRLSSTMSLLSIRFLSTNIVPFFSRPLSSNNHSWLHWNKSSLPHLPTYRIHSGFPFTPFRISDFNIISFLVGIRRCSRFVRSFQIVFRATSSHLIFT